MTKDEVLRMAMLPKFEDLKPGDVLVSRDYIKLTVRATWPDTREVWCTVHYGDGTCSPGSYTYEQIESRKYSLVKPDPLAGFVEGARVVYGSFDKFAVAGDPGVIKSRFDARDYGPVVVVECDDGCILTQTAKDETGAFLYLKLAETK